MKNEYRPSPAVIESVRSESFDTKTFRVSFTSGSVFDYKPGQFAQVSLPGTGEAPISITSSPSSRGFLEFTIRAAGKLTREIHKLKQGGVLYIRGPYGNSFPFNEVKGMNLFFIAGGIGLPPLRSLINEVLASRSDFGGISILYGAKTPDELCFKNEIERWRKIPGIGVFLTVDSPDKGWRGNTGVVTALCDISGMKPSCGAVFICGPPVMIRFVLEKILSAGFKEKDIYITLERYMKCGIGKCGHCNIGGKFVCMDGPVFTYKQIKEFPDKERAI
ncbi:MAG: FAD/NAD(P)-binding protein [bacterium]